MDGEYLSFPQAAKRCPLGPVSPQSVWRWATLGLRAPDGRRVTLRTLKVGRRFATTEKFLEEFFLAAGHQGGDIAAKGGQEEAA
ncbi:MAG: hypothetical protein H3C30_13490 [Candidatus Hydrogenedentes bacterium]|nr:hypothetical protein [Candidatus Hydrogenedentota bacterium]